MGPFRNSCQNQVGFGLESSWSISIWHLSGTFLKSNGHWTGYISVNFHRESSRSSFQSRFEIALESSWSISSPFPCKFLSKLTNPIADSIQISFKFLSNSLQALFKVIANCFQVSFKSPSISFSFLVQTLFKLLADSFQIPLSNSFYFRSICIRILPMSFHNLVNILSKFFQLLWKGTERNLKWRWKEIEENLHGNW